MSTTSPISLSGAVTPTRRSANNPFGGEHDYLRMLREAQRESNRSSSKVSPISSAFISGKTSPNGSPKSPPNTPNHELATSLHEELKAVYINHFVRPDEVHGELTASDIMWDWSSKPNIPCKYVIESLLLVNFEIGNIFFSDIFFLIFDFYLFDYFPFFSVIFFVIL